MKERYLNSPARYEIKCGWCGVTLPVSSTVPGSTGMCQACHDAMLEHLPSPDRREILHVQRPSETAWSGLILIASLLAGIGFGAAVALWQAGAWINAW